MSTDNGEKKGGQQCLSFKSSFSTNTNPQSPQNVVSFSEFRERKSNAKQESKERTIIDSYVRHAKKLGW